MKIGIVLSLFAVLSVSSMAGDQELVSLKNEFQQLRYDVTAERDRGANEMEKVFAALAKFGAKKSNLKDKEEFSRIVALVGAALPFDVETESAGVIEDFIYDNKTLHSVYEATVEAMTDKCRKELFRSVINERACAIKLEKSGKRDVAPDACVAKPAFVYSVCIGMKRPEE